MQIKQQKITWKLLRKSGYTVIMQKDNLKNAIEKLSNFMQMVSDHKKNLF